MNSSNTLQKAMYFLKSLAYRNTLLGKGMQIQIHFWLPTRNIMLSNVIQRSVALPHCRRINRYLRLRQGQTGFQAAFAPGGWRDPKSGLCTRWRDLFLASSCTVLNTALSTGKRLNEPVWMSYTSIFSKSTLRISTGGRLMRTFPSTILTLSA